MTIETHKISVDEVRPGRWRAVCSCEKYRSVGYTYRGAAEDVGRQHVRAKGGAVG